MLRNQQRQQGPVGPASPTAAAPPGTNRARLSGNTSLARGNDLAGVNPQIAQSAKEWAQIYNSKADGAHTAQFTSGNRPGDPREHGRGNAFDMQLIDKSTGKALENYRTNDPKTFAAYQDYANGYHQYLEANYPELAAKHRWGGYFSGDTSKYGSLDQMHHDFAGDRIGMAGGSWKTGLTPQQAKLFPGLTANTGGLAGKPPMAAGKPTMTTPAAAAPGAAPAAAAPGAAPAAAPATGAQPRQGGSAVLAEQRKPVAQYLDSNPSAKEQMAAAAYTEDNNSREGRIAVHEAAANRIVANGRPVSDVIDPKYYQAMNDPAQRAKYDAALAKVKSDPEFRKQLFGEIDQAHKRGTNYAKLATDFASSTSADKSRTNSTSVGKVGGNEFFIKDQHPEVHGAGTVANNKKWLANTQAALAKPTAAPAAEPTATAPASTQAPAQAAAQPVTPAASAAEPPKADATVAPQASSQQLGPSGEEPLQPEPTPAQNTPPSAPPASVAVPSTPAPAAAAPVPPPVAAPPVAVAAKPAPPAPPPKPAAPPVNPAHALLDTSVYELAKKSSASEAAQVKMFLGDKMTLREAMKHPMYGGMATSKAKENLGKAGITPQQFDQAVKEGQPKPTTLGKRSDLGTSEATDFSSRGRTPAPTAAPEAAPAQSSAPAPGEQVPLPQPDPRTEQQPQITPGIARALEDAVKIEEQAPAAPPSAGAMPVLPGQPVAPTPGPGNGGLSLAPAGLSSIPTGALPTGAPGSQGGGIAMAGMLPPIQNSTYSTPLLDQTAATAGSGMGLSPIPLQTLGSWGWGGGSIGAGLDWGGGAPEVPMGAIGGFD
jgi:hypothetical protein